MRRTPGEILSAPQPDEFALSASHSLSQYSSHLSPHAETVIVSLLMCDSYSLRRLFKGKINAVFLNELFSNVMRAVAHGINLPPSAVPGSADLA